MYERITGAEDRNIYEIKYKNYLKGIVKKPHGKAKINLDKRIENSEDRDNAVWNKR
jgi:hypothetical protein